MKFWQSFFSILALSCLLLVGSFVVVASIIFQVLLAVAALLLMALDGFALMVFLVNKKHYGNDFNK